MRSTGKEEDNIKVGHRNDDDGSDGDDAKGAKKLGYGAADGIAKSAKSAVGCSCQHWMQSPMLDALSYVGYTLRCWMCSPVNAKTLDDV